MANINNPQVNVFCNTRLRPFSETLLAGVIEAEELTDYYDENIAPLLAAYADADIIEDGRSSQGVSVLTKADIEGFVAVVKALRTTFTDPYRAVVRKPTVRKISVAAV